MKDYAGMPICPIVCMSISVFEILFQKKLLKTKKQPREIVMGKSILNHGVSNIIVLFFF